MRSLAISDKSIKLKCVFQMEHAIIVLTDVCVNGLKFEILHRKWREQVSKYHIWANISGYRGIMILVRKSSGCYWENLVKLNDDAVLLDFVMPDGIQINTAAVYGPSHTDDWDNVNTNLDLGSSNGGKMILGDYNVTLNFARDT